MMIVSSPRPVEIRKIECGFEPQKIECGYRPPPQSKLDMVIWSILAVQILEGLVLITLMVRR